METQSVKQFSSTDWEEYASYYDALTKLGPYQSLLHEAVRALDIRPDDKILDAACGTGNLMLALWNKCSESGIDLHITGCDSSASMLARAKEKFRGNSSARIIITDLNMTLPFTDESFDSIASINTLYALTCPKATLREFCRVLRVGGKLVLVTPKQGYENGLILKDHCGSTKPDAYWKNIHVSSTREKTLILEACGDTLLSETLIRVGEFNRVISANKNFHFFSQQALEHIVANSGFKLMQHSFTYTSQCHLIVAHKLSNAERSYHEIY